MRKFKVFGLLAVSAIAAMALASNASASEIEAEEIGKTISATTLTGHVLTVTEKKVECGSTKFEGTTEVNSDPNFTVHPAYAECKGFGLSATVTTKGCDYRFNANTTSGMGSLSIVDHAGETCNGIVITADGGFTTCTILVPKQTISSAVSYTNNSSKLKAKITATGIEANVTASTGLCGLTTGVHSGEKGASLNGESEIAAEGTNLKWWEQDTVKPTFTASISPTNLVLKPNDKSKIKIEENGKVNEDWKLRATILQLAQNNWKEFNLAGGNCQGHDYVGGNKEKCEFEVECLNKGNETTVAIYWTYLGRLDESYFGPINCP
ncbi:MAG TPA: hypothetical protein VFI17_10570 [Solirubrobacterales bacterium]|nr:hypothetical protein [Solirubrobacterales bacterium]